MMELLSNNSLSAQMASATGNNGATNGNPNNGATTAERLLAGILDTFPAWDIGNGMMNNDASNE